jgi:nicotinamidase-related amidase
MESQVMKTALLVVDVQAGLCTGEWAAFEIDAVIGRINGAIAQARAAQALIVFIQHEEVAGPLQFGSADWQLDARLHANPDDPSGTQIGGQRVSSHRLAEPCCTRMTCRGWLYAGCKASFVLTPRCGVRWSRALPSPFCRMRIPP